jgi:hypothetical protein
MLLVRAKTKEWPGNPLLYATAAGVSKCALGRVVAQFENSVSMVERCRNDDDEKHSNKGEM